MLVTPTSRRMRRCCTTPGTGDAGDVLLHALPIFHVVHGLFVALHCALLGGSRVIFHARFDADGVIDRPRQEATVMMGVPTFYTRLLDNPWFTPRHCANMRLFISARRRCWPTPTARSRRVPAPHPRALWHDRGRHDHVQSL